jgi:dTDP-glucose 4,6-dehydratase
MQRVLITGAAGFLGSHLCERFLQANYLVLGMDNFLTGSPDNIVHLLPHPNFQFFKYDVTQFIYVEGAVYLILHFACPASPVDYLNHPIHTMKVDSLGTLHTLGLARVKKARYVFASTSEIYGDAAVHPQPESYWGNVNPIGPRSVYDEAKRFSEAMVMAYRRTHQIDVRIARIFNTYGPRMRPHDGRVIPTFLTQAMRGEPITMFGDGKQTRSFCFVSDLIEGIFRLATLDNITGEVFNLGNPAEYTMEELARIIIAITKSEAKIVYAPLPQDDPRHRQPDISKAMRILKWQPQVELAEGLRHTITYLQTRLGLTGGH